MSQSKYKLITGKLINSRWTDFKLHEMPTEGQLLSVNKSFVATVWEGAGGVVSVLDKYKPYRVPHDINLIRGHLVNVNDVRFSPFIPNLLATSSDDGTIKMWQIPEEGLTKDMDSEVQKYSEHGKKVYLTTFHPCSRDIAASFGVDNQVHVWSIANGKNYLKIPTKDYMSSLDWNYNGSLLGTITKEKLVYIIDPRKNNIVLQAKAHESGKPQKMVWVDPQYYITTGFGKGNVREIKLFDIRKATEGPVQTNELDHQTGTMFPWYDYDSNVIYIPSKGEAIIHFFGYSNGGIAKLNEYRMEHKTKVFTFGEKRFSNYQENEMTIMYKCVENSLEMESIYVPRKAGYDPTLFPDTFCGESALDGDEWFSGVDKDRILKSIDQAAAGNGSLEGVNIVKKQEVVVEEPLDVQVKKLKEEVAFLKAEVEKKEGINEQLRKENERLKDLLNKKSA